MIESNNHDYEINLLDIFEFLLESWKTIIGLTMLGILGAIFYLWAVPNQYEASAQIKMAQIANSNNNNFQIGINIEEPQALIARMALPTSYPKETIVLCGLAEQKDPEVALASKVKLSIPKGVGGTVDLRIRDPSKGTAKACANAIYQLIKSSQEQYVAPYIDEARKKLKIEEERLSLVTHVINKTDKSGVAISASYLSTRDEIRYLREQISSLQNIIIANESRGTYLTAPIYVSDQPVFPQKRNSFLVGLLLGGVLGIVLSLTLKWYRCNYPAIKRMMLGIKL